MLKFMQCGHYSQKCPCLECDSYTDLFDCPLSCQNAKGIVRSEETRRKMSEAHKKKGVTNGSNQMA